MDMKKVLILCAISCFAWLLFMLVDVIFLAALSIKAPTHTKIFPDLFFCALALASFLTMGIISGLLAFIMYYIKEKLFAIKPSDVFYLPLSLAISLNGIINLYLFYRNLLMLRSIVLIALGVLSLLALQLIFMQLTAYFKKQILSTIIALAVSVEFCINIIRYFGADGYWLKSLTFAPVVLVAIGISLFVFISIYYGVGSKIIAKKYCVIVLLFLLASVAALNRGKATAEPDNDSQMPATEKSNVILIIMDTTRVDHLSCYGYERKTTPHIDEFAKESVLYARAYSTASWTLPSAASILTGLYPGAHGVHRTEKSDIIFPANKLSEDNITLAEILAQSGYETAGIISAVFLGREYGLHQGFNYFDDTVNAYLVALSAFRPLSFLNLFIPIVDYLCANGLYDSRIADQINTSAFSWLDQKKKKAPFFLLIHYFDPHDPYLPEELGISKNAIPEQIRKKHANRTVNYTDLESSIIYSVQRGKKPLLPEEKALLVDNYDREINLLDKKIGQLLNKLKEKNIFDNSLIIITADHGEAFGEHDLMLHGVMLYEDNIHVPLLIKYPFAEKRKKIVNEPVSLTGLVPTILSYAKIPVPKTIQGSPFYDLASQKIIAQNFKDPSWGRSEEFKRFDQNLISLIEGDFKIIKSMGGSNQLYNIKTDPQEQNNLIGESPQVATRLLTTLENYIMNFGLLTKKDNQIEINEIQIQNLKGLGYIN
jgi:arylsulfatase